MSVPTLEPIAIVGFGGRFPGAADPQQLWELVCAGNDAVTEAPADRPWLRELYNPVPGTPGAVCSARGGFLRGLDLFDADFFGIAGPQADRLDPQVRLLLEVAWQTARDAGIPARLLSSHRTGVFVGNMYADYWQRQLFATEGLDFHGAVGAGARAGFSGHLAYHLGLRGPCLTLDTACSSSLMAVHLACQSLRSGECDLAFAGGANLILTPYDSIPFAGTGALSPRGRCRFADQSADGYVRSEAAGLVLLKPLDKAVADGDRVRAVILGSAVNTNGFTAAGMAAPSTDSQTDLLRVAYAQAGVDPLQVAFVEAHGSGTVLGDTAELTALSRVLGPRPAGAPCLVGSAKVCIGHTEAAAGVVGLIKAVLSLEHRTVPGIPQLENPIPQVNQPGSPLRIEPRPVTLPPGSPLVAGVNSFGVTGTNVHLVLGSAPDAAQPPRQATDDLPLLLSISAKSPQALEQLSERYLHQIDDGCDPSELQRLCTAANTRSDHWEYRSAFVAMPGELADTLRDQLRLVPRRGTFGPSEGIWQRPRIVFVFPGQGAQWAGMGKDLLTTHEVFRETLAACDDVIIRDTRWSVIEALTSMDSDWISVTAKVQPALWAISMALAALWRSWGIEPDAVLGQSQGEIAAAQCAGALTVEQAGRLVCARSRLVERHAAPGGMCWVERDAGAVLVLLDQLGVTATVAVEEGPESAVIAGTDDELNRFVGECARLGITCQRVPVDYAAHSPLIETVREPFLHAVAGLSPTDSAVPFWSTASATLVAGRDLAADYWWSNLRKPVRLDETVRALARTAIEEERPTIFVQCSPHPILSVALRASSRRTGADVGVVASLRRDEPELASLYSSLAELYVAGAEIDWERVHHGATGHVDLPAYPWERTSHWHQPPQCPWPAIRTEQPPEEFPDSAAAQSNPESLEAGVGDHRWLGAAVPAPEVAAPSWQWQFELGPDSAFLLDHRVGGRSVMPGAGFLEIMVAAAVRLNPGQQICVRRAVFGRLLYLPRLEDNGIELRVIAESAAGAWNLTVASRSVDGLDDDCVAQWTDHAYAVLVVEADSAPEQVVLPADLVPRGSAWQAGEDFYRAQSGTANDWQGSFRSIAELWRGGNEVVARIRPTSGDGFYMHPARLDACLQTVLALPCGLVEENSHTRVLLGVDHVALRRPRAAGSWWIHAQHRAGADVDEICADVVVYDGDGCVVAEFTGVRGRNLAGSPVPTHDVAAPAHSRHTLTWREIDLPAGKVESSMGKQSGTWVQLCAGTPMDTTVADELRALGHRVATVVSGSGFAAEGQDSYRAASGSGADLARVLKEIDRSGPIRAVVSMWALAPGAGADAEASVQQVQWTATDLCAALVLVHRAILELAPTRTPDLFVLTRGAQAVRPDDICPAPWQAALWGFGPVLSRELSGGRCRLLDLDPHPLPDVGRSELPAAVATALVGLGAETRLALRAGRWHVARLRPVEEGSPTAAAHRVIRSAATYLVTGGLGGVGALVARWLIDQGARNVLLTGRRAIGDNDVTAVRLLEQLRATGARVDYASVDVADLPGMAELLRRRAADGLPPVAGLVHTAAVLDPGMVSELAPTSLNQAMRAKVAGSWALHRLFQDTSLDFWVLFSSAASILGELTVGHQLAAYAAGNAFADSLVAFRRGERLPATVVNWGYWAEVGLAARLSEQSGHEVRPTGLQPILPAQAPGLFAAMLNAEGRLIYIPVDWQEYLTAYPDDAALPILADVVPAEETLSCANRTAVPVSSEPTASEPTAVAAAPMVSIAGPATEQLPRRDLEDYLIERFAEVLGCAPQRINATRPLNKLGMDSLMATTLRQRLECDLHLQVTVPQVLTAPNLRTLATQLCQAGAYLETSRSQR